jgi:SAM-dependent methyltransferase
MFDDVIEKRGEDDRKQAERFWEERYQQRAQLWSGNVNPLLVDVVGQLPAAGTALDLGCGEGGDAIWLAQQGWRVTAVDVSVTALKRAATYAATAGVASRIDFQQHDLAYTFPAGSFDLISAQFLQSPLELPRDRILQTAARAVALGGLLLIVTHASVPSWASMHNSHPRFPTVEEELAQLNLNLEHWRIERLDVPERQVIGPNGEAATVADNIVAVRRIMQ